MRNFLPDFFNTLTTRRQRRVADVLEEARIGKTELGAVVRSLENTQEFAPLTLAREATLGRTSAINQMTNFRDAGLHFRDMFIEGNNISLLLDSHTSILSSEVKALEDELLALEKLARNYAFLLEEGRSFSYAYLEPFNDELGRDTTLAIVPDRADSFFNTNESAVVRSSEGVLVLPLQTQTHGLVGTVLSGNALAMSTQTGSLANLTNKSSTSGWQLIVRSPNPITTSVSDVEATGAQVVLEFTATQPSPASEVSVLPFADYTMELLQVTIFTKDDDSTGEDLLTEPRLLDRPTSLHFPMKVVSRFRIILNQPVYARRSHVINTVEERYRTIFEEVRTENPEALIPDTSTPKAVRRRYRRKGGIPDLPSFDRSSGASRTWYDRVRPSRTSSWEQTDSIFSSLFVQQSANIQPLIRTPQASSYTQPGPDNYKPVLVEVPPRNDFSGVNFDYEYRIGLYGVTLSVDAPGHKGTFVSKPFDSPGDLGEVRLKADDTNYFLPGTITPRQITSTEYSVSNRSHPEAESDWIPIMPLGQSEVVAERFFPDQVGKGYFRFPASQVASVNLFKDQIPVPLIPENYLYNSTNTEIVGLRLDPYIMSKDSIFTVDYVPVKDHTLVSFEAAGFGDVPLVSAFDQDGAGEGYLSTSGLNEITLKHYPYIDADRAEEANNPPDLNAILSIEDYNPIIVRLSNGVIATNLTDYVSGTQQSFPDEAHGVFFLNSGNVLSFNQPVQDFRVFYQYLQNSVRVRVVLRSNHKDFVSPRVDYYHIKGKVRKSNLLDKF